MVGVRLYCNQAKPRTTTPASMPDILKVAGHRAAVYSCGPCVSVVPLAFIKSDHQEYDRIRKWYRT